MTGGSWKCKLSKGGRSHMCGARWQRMPQNYLASFRFCVVLGQWVARAVSVGLLERSDLSWSAAGMKILGRIIPELCSAAGAHGRNGE